MFQLTARLKKAIEFDPSSETRFNEKSTLRLVCFDRCGLFCPFPAYFTKDSETLSHRNDARVNVTMAHTSNNQTAENAIVLTITNLTLNDSGSYRCISGGAPDKYDELNVTIASKCYRTFFYKMNLYISDTSFKLLKIKGHEE